MNEDVFYRQLISEFRKVVEENNLLDEEVLITGRTLSVEEAIGNPERKDYPIVKGKESLMQAEFKGEKGQAFTDMAGNYSGTLQDILNTSPANNFDRAVLIAAMNAVCRYLGYIDRTVHCHDEEPVKCAVELAEHIKSKYGNPRIALIGLQPAMLQELTKYFQVRVVDMDVENIGQKKSGVVVEGMELTSDVLEWCDLIAATGSTVVNATISTYCENKPAIFFGTTGAAATYLMGLKRWCYMGA